MSSNVSRLNADLSSIFYICIWNELNKLFDLTGFQIRNLWVSYPRSLPLCHSDCQMVSKCCIALRSNACGMHYYMYILKASISFEIICYTNPFREIGGCNYLGSFCDLFISRYRKVCCLDIHNRFLIINIGLFLFVSMYSVDHGQML